MLVSARVVEALEAQRAQFQNAARVLGEDRERYLAAFHALRTEGSPAVAARIGGVEWPGAWPTAELDERGPIVRFPHRWQHAQEARAWALGVLEGLTTIAVDGSQIAASREFGVPIALAQAAWFENPHRAGRSYQKDVRDEVLLPGAGDMDELAFAESRLNQRRYTLELAVIAERVRQLASPDPNRPPVAFHDGTFVLSFTGRMPENVRVGYLDALFAGLDASAEARVPVVGYIDHSLASDLVTMLSEAWDLPETNLFDAQMLGAGEDAALAPFDRTAAFRCARKDIMPHYQRPAVDRSAGVCFVLLGIGPDRLPARIDFPSWVLDAGLLDHVMDVIRAEIVVGSGYPYALETADAAAVLTTEDRLNFYRLWHEFALGAGLNAGATGKIVSKLRRR